MTEIIPPIDLRCLIERLAVVETQVVEMKEQTIERVRIAIATAEKALTKVEAAADRVNVDNQITALKETIVTQIEYQKDAIQAALVSADRAVTKAEISAEKRFESVNEFRATLADQQRDLATKTECDLRFRAVEDRLTESIRTRLSQVEALSERIAELGADMREQKGRGSGLNAGWGYLIGAIGVAATIVTLIVMLLRTH